MNALAITLPCIFLLSGCVYTDSALQYAKEGTHRVNSGYLAKENMTKYLVDYMKEANKDCGVKSQFIDGIPTTTVKECVDVEDIMASVDRVQIVQPQAIKDIADSAGDFIMKATNLAVPFASIYYGSKNHEVTANANTAMNASDNQADTSIFGAYATNFQNTSTSVSDVSDTSNTNISTTVNDVVKETIDVKDYSDTRIEEVAE